MATPLDLGGWLTWGLAFREVVTALGSGPTHAFVVDQPSRSERYVQGLVGHRSATVQASSNVYLHGPSRLSATDEATLVELGWCRPTRSDDSPSEEPANWTYGPIRDDWGWVAGLVVHTVIAVLGFAEDEPVATTTFLADRPCRRCSGWWLDGDADAATEA